MYSSSKVSRLKFETLVSTVDPGGDMRHDMKKYVWQKEYERRKEERRKKTIDGIMIKDFDRREEEEDHSYKGAERRTGKDRRNQKDRRNRK